jgi:hypothetical protein
MLGGGVNQCGVGELRSCGIMKEWGGRKEQANLPPLET